MKRNRTKCRHPHALPAVVNREAGFLWCPDCGAFRPIKLEGGTVCHYAARWVYPTGIDDALKQLEAIKQQLERG